MAGKMSWACGLAKMRAPNSGQLCSFDGAIHATFPQTEIQNCIIHQLRNSSKYVFYKDPKALMADLKAVYAAVDEQAALNALGTFGDHWDKKYPKISPSGHDGYCEKVERAAAGLEPDPCSDGHLLTMPSILPD